MSTIALFGEAELGEYRMGYFCKSLDELAMWLGEPPGMSRGLHIAIQALLFNHQLIYFRVQEEGFSFEDYHFGIEILKNEPLGEMARVFCLPGVGDKEILNSLMPFCHQTGRLLITSEPDLYDYLFQG